MFRKGSAGGMSERGAMYQFAFLADTGATCWSCCLIAVILGVVGFVGFYGITVHNELAPMWEGIIKADHDTQLEVNRCWGQVHSITLFLPTHVQNEIGPLEQLMQADYQMRSANNLAHTVHWITERYPHLQSFTGSQTIFSDIRQSWDSIRRTIDSRNTSPTSIT